MECVRKRECYVRDEVCMCWRERECVHVKESVCVREKERVCVRKRACERVIE